MGAKCGEFLGGSKSIPYVTPTFQGANAAAGVIYQPIGALGYYFVDNMNGLGKYRDLKYTPLDELKPEEQDPTIKGYMDKFNARKKELDSQIEEKRKELKLSEKAARESGNQPEISKAVEDSAHLEQDSVSLNINYTWVKDLLGKFNQASRDFVPNLKALEMGRIKKGEPAYDTSRGIKEENGENTPNNRAIYDKAQELRDVLFFIANPRKLYDKDVYFQPNRCDPPPPPPAVPIHRNPYRLFNDSNDFTSQSIAEEIVNRTRADAEKEMRENAGNKNYKIARPKEPEPEFVSYGFFARYGEGVTLMKNSSIVATLIAVGLYTPVYPLIYAYKTFSYKENPIATEYLAEVTAKKDTLIKDMEKTSDSESIERIKKAHGYAMRLGERMTELVNEYEPKIKNNILGDVAKGKYGRDGNKYTGANHEEVDRLLWHFQTNVDRAVDNGSSGYREEFNEILPKDKFSDVLMKHVLDDVEKEMQKPKDEPEKKSGSIEQNKGILVSKDKAADLVSDKGIVTSTLDVNHNDIISQRLPANPNKSPDSQLMLA